MSRTAPSTRPDSAAICSSSNITPRYRLARGRRESANSAAAAIRGTSTNRDAAGARVSSPATAASRLTTDERADRTIADTKDRTVSTWPVSRATATESGTSLPSTARVTVALTNRSTSRSRSGSIARASQGNIARDAAPAASRHPPSTSR